MAPVAFVSIPLTPQVLQHQHCHLAFAAAIDSAQPSTADHAPQTGLPTDQTNQQAAGQQHVVSELALSSLLDKTKKNSSFLGMRHDPSAFVAF